MSLRETIAENTNDISGSRTKNRLTVQISYAIQLIIEFYTMDHIILMDYVEDVAIIESPDNPSYVHLYQVKTKSSDKQYTLNTVIKDEWFQKLYKNALKYESYIKDVSLVCNTDIVNNSKKVFVNSCSNLGDLSGDTNVKKIIKVIADDIGVKEDEVDLSKFFFVRTTLTTDGHKKEVEHQFEDFLLDKAPDLQLATARTLYKIIYDELDKRFNCEIDENCTDVDEIFKKKGFKSKDIESFISTGLAIQLPTTDILFDRYQISSIKEIKKYNMQYSQMKMDLCSDVGLLSDTKKRIGEVISDVMELDLDDLPSILEKVYTECMQRDIIPAAFSDEYYLKLLIMIMIYKIVYVNGGC